MLPILAAFLTFIIIASIGWVLVGSGDSSSQALKRAETLGSRQAAQKARKAAPASAAPEARRKQILSQLKDADRKERKSRVTMAARLRQAGLSLSIRTFWIISASLGVFALLLALLFGASLLLSLGVAVVFGLGLPRWVVSFIGKRRMTKFSLEFPNAVDVIVRGIKSGLPVHDCFKIIARESPAPLGPEFQRLVEGLGVGLTLQQALERMYDRLPTPELRFFTIVIGIQQKSGGNLAEALGNLSTVLRARRLMGEKIKALASEATASAGIIGSLPPVVMGIVMVTTPAYMMLMFTETRGQVMLIIAAMWMGIGIFMMKRMIAFKF
jgi:tight adherence protein B